MGCQEVLPGLYYSNPHYCSLSLSKARLLVSWNPDRASLSLSLPSCKIGVMISVSYKVAVRMRRVKPCESTSDRIGHILST